MPLLFACLGIILSMKKASFLNVSLTRSDPQIGTLNFNQVISFGNTQAQAVTQSITLNGNPVPFPQDLPTISIKSACPDINGKESCSNGGSASDPSNTCVPSSAWALIVVNQLFASVAIIVQVAMAIALYIGKGNRIIHQILNGIAVITLLISVASIMNVPARLYQVCLSPTLDNLSNLGGSSRSVSYTLDVGGKRLRTAPSFAKISHAAIVTARAAALLLAALLFQILNIAANHKLLDGSVAPAGATEFYLLAAMAATTR
jgi:hypothetical protein